MTKDSISTMPGTHFEFSFLFVTVLCLLEVFHVGILASNNVCKGNDVDGCSTPFNMYLFYKKTFTPACYRHDVCYLCGYQRHMSRKQCDNVFHQDMLTACNKKGFWSRFFCKAILWLYYFGVRMFGADSYEKRSSTYCSDESIQQCLDLPSLRK